MFLNVTTFLFDFRKFTDVFMIHLNLLEFRNSGDCRFSFEEISDVQIPWLLVRKVVVALYQRTFPESHEEVAEPSSNDVSVITLESGKRSVRAWNWSFSLRSWPVLLESSDIDWDLVALTGSSFNKDDHSIVHFMAVDHYVLALATDKHSHLGSLSEAPSLKVFFTFDFSNGVVNVLLSSSINMSPVFPVVFEVAALGFLPVPSLTAIVAHAFTPYSWSGVSEGDLSLPTKAVNNASLVLLGSWNGSHSILLVSVVNCPNTHQQAWQTDKYSQANVKDKHAHW